MFAKTLKPSTKNAELYVRRRSLVLQSATLYVSMMFDPLPSSTPFLQSGQLRPLAVTTARRVPTLPEIPTTAEAGMPGFEITVWHGLYAPRGTPAPVCARLTQSLQAALREPRVAERFAGIGTTPVSQEAATPEAHRRFWMADIAKWKPVIEATGAYAD